MFESPGRLIISAAIAFSVAGCTVGPNYQRPDTSMPDSWHAPKPEPTTQATSLPTTRSLTIESSEPVAKWWETFNDPQLNALIDRCVKSNLDLRAATYRIRQARAQRGVVASALYPDVNADGSYSRSHSSGAARSAHTFDHSTDFFQAGLDASWEVDVFGGVRRDVEASDADIAAAVEDRRDVLVSLLAEVAVDYIQLRAFQQEIAIARANLDLQQKTVAVTRRRMVGGLAASLDVANAESQVATTASQLPELESSAERTIYALSVLLGQQPDALEAELSVEKPIPTTPPEVPIGLPSDLLRRRPDLRRSERQLAAATARIGVAVSDLFPKFSLTGSLGLQNGKFNDLGNLSSRYWSIGPSVSWPIFDAGRIGANIDVQNAAQMQALTAYQSTVLTSLQDVKSALVAYSKEQVHRKAIEDAVAADQKAVDVANRLYVQGLTNFLNVLDAQRSLLASQDALVQSEQAVSADLVALYKALGGGWEVGEIDPHYPASTQPNNHQP